MDLAQLGVVAAVFFVFSLISKRIERGVLTPPILFTLAGAAAHFTLLPVERVSFSESALHTLAEITLVLVLAADASRISASSLYMNRAIPIRLLAVGLPLTIAFGAALGDAVLPGHTLLQAALLAAILAPTDAALGASVLSNESVPLRIRQSLNVESGLNDGIALPAVLFFACFFNLTHQTGEVNWIAFLALQLTLGPAMGAGFGWAGGKLIGWSMQRGWITESFQGVAAMALAILAFVAAENTGGNGFIAAFVCGLVYGNIGVKYSHFLYEFTETESQVLAHLTFFLFGLIILPHAAGAFTPEIFAYAALSLTVVRMVPVAAAMLGSKLHPPTVAFMGWFGPRGLASLLFALLILEDLEVEQAESLQAVVAATVLLSILAHGATAAPFSRRYGAWAARRTTPACAENQTTGAPAPTK